MNGGYAFLNALYATPITQGGIVNILSDYHQSSHPAQNKRLSAFWNLGSCPLGKKGQ
jgi:hypothetical protein